MARPSRTGGKKSEVKARNASAAKGRKTPKTNRPIAPAAPRVKRRPASAPSKYLKEAREQQAATAEILKVIAGSPSDVQPVFEAIASRAKRLIGGFSTAVFRFVDDVAHLAAFTPTNPAADGVLKASFPRPRDDSPFLRLVRNGQPVQIADIETSSFDARIRDIARARGYRSILYAPLMSQGASIGAISVTRKEPGTFVPHHVQLLQTFADQAVIAIENARLFNETKEALKRQTATADILKVIASSPTKLQPVFDAIAERSNRLLLGHATAVYRFVGDEVHLEAFTSVNPEADAALRASYPRAISGESQFDIVRGGNIAQIADVHSDEVEAITRATARARGWRAIIFAPLAGDSGPMGAISVTRKEPGAFASAHVQLLRTFADQAVIAIQNVEMFEQVRAKTRDLSEALTYQTGSANILKVIASSPTDVGPVLKAIVESACELCDAPDALVRLREGDYLCHGAHHGPIPVGFERRPLDRNFITSRTVVDKVTIHLHDVLSAEGDEFPEAQRMSRGLGTRTFLCVPLLRENESIGAIALRRTEVNPFSEKQIALLQTFADQAVIALSNVRLFDEVQARTEDLRESLQFQTAASEVLKVISRSPDALQPVLDVIVDTSRELCGSDSSAIFLLRDRKFHVSALSGSIPPHMESLRTNPQSIDQPNSVLSRAAREKRTRHYPNILDDPEMKQGPAALGGARALLIVPLLRDNDVLGVIVLRQSHLKPFTPRQIQAIETFADQAAIAISNVNLFDEVQARTRDLTESLQQQTATSEVLKVISSSPGELEPVFKSMLENAVSICDAKFGNLFLVEGDSAHWEAGVGTPPTLAQYFTQSKAFRPTPGSHLDRVMRTKRVSHTADDTAEAVVGAAARLGGARSTVCVPMVKDNALVGTIFIYRTEVRPFTDKQIDLVKNFAAQAVIAIENTRLLKELRQRTDDLSESLEQQTATSEVLEVISASPGELEPVFRKMLENATRVCGANFGMMQLWNGETFSTAAAYNVPPAFAALREGKPIHVHHPQSGLSNVLKSHQVVHLHDVTKGAAYLGGDPNVVQLADIGGARTVVLVPMLKEDEFIGTFTIYRQEVRPFTDKQIALVENFTKQAVIAIENTRLLKELRARTDDLSESLQQQTATADVLKVISSSAFELQPVLDVIVETSRELCGSDASTIFLVRNRKFHVTAVSGALPTHLEFLRSNPASVDQPGSILARVYCEKRTLHYPNVADDPELSQGMTGLGGPRALLTVPLMRHDEVIGAITLRQSHLKPFTARQIEAIEVFADQAVIAISNVGLFEQVQERTRELSQSIDELRTAQDRLVQTEKLASLGQLTAGIAHEIKNPLNFVNNFSALSTELIEEMKDMLSDVSLDKNKREDLDEITQMLKSNLDKVVQHGKRADSIVKNMLLHSRQGSGEHRPVDINAIVDESLNLAYHGARAERTGFNITMHRSFDPAVGVADGYPQEITRALLNLISNGFYAATKRKADADDGFEPTLTATTKNLGDKVEIRIRDNGTGIPTEVKEKIFNPFFTTKPAGEGTGLGLSMSHDIIVKQHGGTMDVDTVLGVFTEFKIVLPRVGVSLIKPGEHP